MGDVTQSPQVQQLLDRASGLDRKAGDPRLKAIMRDVLAAFYAAIEKHEVSEDEVWAAVDFLGKAAPEFGLIVPGLGLERFLDVLMDEADRKSGVAAGTPRAIEGPLFVEGAPLCERDAVMSEKEDEGLRLAVHGFVRDVEGSPTPGAIIDVWHADTRGFYSHFDPTGAQGPFNNRRKIRVGGDGAYSVRSILPVGYSVPPGGATDRLMKALGRHGSRPAHIHFFVRAPGYRHLTTQINIADDPLVHDDFAFATREGLIPELKRSGGEAEIRFDFSLVKDAPGSSYRMSSRPRMSA